jgi:DNA-binding MarR family transcriptional regulator
MRLGASLSSRMAINRQGFIKRECRVCDDGTSLKLWPWNKLSWPSLDISVSVLYCPYMNEKIAFSLIHAAHSIEGRFEEALAEVNLSSPKFAALSVLVAEDQPISLSDLAEKLTCVRSNVTQLVDRLEADGLVKRSDDPVDRRGVRAEVTKFGRERHAAGLTLVNRVHEEVARQLSTVDQNALKRAFDAIQ